MSQTVIVGGGIIGFSTAYYLATRLGDGSSITVNENHVSPFKGASGQATGILGDYGFDDAATPLGKCSWELHNSLADEYDGRNEWGFSDIIVHKLNKFSSSVAESGHTSKHPLPSWCRTSENYVDTIVNNLEHHAARL